MATYDGGKITSEELSAEISRLPEGIRSAAVKQVPEFLDSYLSQQILVQEAERRGIQHQADVKDMIRRSREQILVNKLLTEEISLKAEVTERMARTYYETHQDEFRTPFRLRASHILVRTREQAEGLLEKIKEGEDFSELAKVHSIDPTGSSGGDIGYFRKGQLIPEIEEAAFSMKEGEISEVIQSSFGFHVLKLTGEARSQVVEFDRVAEEIKEKLRVEKADELLNDLTNGLKKKLRLKVDESALKGFEYDAADKKENDDA